MSNYFGQVKEFLDGKEFSQPYSKKDLVDAIEFGRMLLTKEIEHAMVGMVVNGTVQPILTESKLKEIMNG